MNQRFLILAACGSWHPFGVHRHSQFLVPSPCAAVSLKHIEQTVPQGAVSPLVCVHHWKSSWRTPLLHACSSCALSFALAALPLSHSPFPSKCFAISAVPVVGWHWRMWFLVPAILNLSKKNLCHHKIHGIFPRSSIMLIVSGPQAERWV